MIPIVFLCSSVSGISVSLQCVFVTALCLSSHSMGSGSAMTYIQWEYCTHVSVAVCIFKETRYHTVGTCSLTCFSHLLYHIHSFVLTRTHTHTPGSRPGCRDRILEVPLSAEVCGHLIGLLCLGGMTMRSPGDYLDALKGTHEPLTMAF